VLALLWEFRSENKHSATEVKALDNCRLQLTLDAGQSGTVDLSGIVGKSVFAAWNDPAAFRAVKIEPLK